MKLLKLPYNEAKPLIRDGDILLQRGKSTISKFLKISGKGAYSHAGVASWVGGSLEILQFREFRGGEALSFSSQVRRFPGQWDVFRPSENAEILYFDGKAVQRMEVKTDPVSVCHFFRQHTGTSYGWGNIFFASLRHLFFVRLFFPAEINDLSNSKSPPYCSQAIATCWRLTHTYKLESGQTVHLDLVPRLADWLTEPSDLSRSTLLNYLFTVGKDKGKKEQIVW